SQLGPCPPAAVAPKVGWSLRRELEVRPSAALEPPARRERAAPPRVPVNAASSPAEIDVARGGGEDSRDRLAGGETASGCSPHCCSHRQRWRRVRPRF